MHPSLRIAYISEQVSGTETNINEKRLGASTCVENKRQRHNIDTISNPFSCLYLELLRTFANYVDIIGTISSLRPLLGHEEYAINRNKNILVSISSQISLIINELIFSLLTRPYPLFPFSGLHVNGPLGRGILPKTDLMVRWYYHSIEGSIRHFVNPETKLSMWNIPEHFVPLIWLIIIDDPVFCF